MIGLDTNVLVRYLVADDEGQATAARETIRAAADRGESLFLTSVVQCELVWVLESAYGFEREAIGEVLEKLLLTEQFEFEHRSVTWRALARFRGSDADFSDFLIGETAIAAGARRTTTFDRALADQEGFEVLPADA